VPDAAREWMAEVTSEKRNLWSLPFLQHRF
jgi:hypothetical protein